MGERCLVQRIESAVGIQALCLDQQGKPHELSVPIGHKPQYEVRPDSGLVELRQADDSALTVGGAAQGKQEQVGDGFLAGRDSCLVATDEPSLDGRGPDAEQLFNGHAAFWPIRNDGAPNRTASNPVIQERIARHAESFPR